MYTLEVIKVMTANSILAKVISFVCVCSLVIVTKITSSEEGNIACQNIAIMRPTITFAPAQNATHAGGNVIHQFPMQETAIVTVYRLFGDDFSTITRSNRARACESGVHRDERTCDK